jgi:hypothetical protein
MRLKQSSAHVILQQLSVTTERPARRRTGWTSGNLASREAISIARALLHVADEVVELLEKAVSWKSPAQLPFVVGENVAIQAILA